MIKTKDLTLFEQIENLSELELAELLDCIQGHLYKNNMLHLTKNLGYGDEEIEELQERVEELEKDLKEAEGKLEDIRMIL